MEGWEDHRGMGRWVPCRSGWVGLCLSTKGVRGCSGGFATTSCLCESSAFLFCCCQKDSPALRPQALSKLCRITPLLVLQGEDKCGNAYEDNGNLIHQHKSAQASLPRDLSRRPSLPRSQQSPHHARCHQRPSAALVSVQQTTRMHAAPRQHLPPQPLHS